MSIKVNRRDDTFAKLVAESKEAPGFSYAKSRNRDYKGFNDDFQAEKLLKDNDIQQAVSIYRRHIIASDIVGRQEALIDLSARFRAPDATAVMMELQALDKMRLEPEVFRSRLAAIDTRAVKNIKKTKHGWQVEGLDKSHLAARILTLAGVDVSKPITDEGKVSMTFTESAQKAGWQGTQWGEEFLDAMGSLSGGCILIGHAS